MRFCCCLGRNSIRRECKVACLLGWPQTDTQAPPRISGSALWDLCCWCALALYPNCLPTKKTPVRARFRTTDPSLPACICSCPATPRYRTLWQAEKFRFSFSDTVVFLWNHAPNTRPVRNPRQESPSFYPTFLQTASLVSAVSCFALFFRKRQLPFALLENTMDSPANGSHGTGTPRLFPDKNHPLDILQFVFPHLGHTFDDGYAHPSAGPRVPSSWPPFSHTPCGRRTLFHKQFRAAAFALLDTPPLSFHSYKPLHAASNGMLWWVLLDIRHMHNVSSLCWTSWSTKRALRKCWCPSGANRSCQSVKALQRQSHIRQPPAGNDFWSKENAFYRSVFELDASRQSLRPTREFFLCYEHDAPLDEPQCIWKYKARRRTYLAPTNRQANLTTTPLQYVKELAGPR